MMTNHRSLLRKEGKGEGGGGLVDKSWQCVNKMSGLVGVGQLRGDVLLGLLIFMGSIGSSLFIISLFFFFIEPSSKCLAT